MTHSAPRKGWRLSYALLFLPVYLRKHFVLSLATVAKYMNDLLAPCSRVCMPHVAFASPLWMSQVPESIGVAVATWVEATELSAKEIDIACKGDVLLSVSDRTPK